MSYSRAYNPILHFDDNDGHPLKNGWLYTFLAGTSTPVATAANEDGSAMNPVNIRLDSRGECEAWLDTSKKYKFEIWNTTRTWRKTVDNVSAGYGGSGGGGGGVSPSDLKTLTIKKGNRVLGTYSPLEQKSIDVSESIVFLDEQNPNLYQAITQLLLSDMVPVLMKSNLDPNVPGGVRRDFYYYPTSRTGVDGDYSFIGYDGQRSEIATVHQDNSVTYTTIEVPTASTASPSMDGIASAGSSTQWSRGDHVHPTDTSREAASNKTTTVRQNGQADNTRFPTEAAVRTAIDSAVSSAYHAAGTKTVAQLTGSLLVSANEGDVYNITDSGVTTSYFIEGAGHPISVGDNVVVCDVGGGVYKFDLLSGFVDLTNYLTKTGDGSDVTASFTAASTRTNVTTGEKLSVLFGKVAKWLGDLKSLAFKDSVTDSEISGTIADSHIASAATWNGKQNTISTDSDSSDISDATTIATGYGSDKVHLNTAARLWAYIQGKISTVLGLTSSTYAGTAGTAVKLPTAYGGFDNQVGHRLLATVSAPSAWNDRICSFSVFETKAGQTDPAGQIGVLTLQIRNNNGSYSYGAYYRGVDSNTFNINVKSNDDHSISVYVYSSGGKYGGIKLVLASSSGYTGYPTGLSGLTLYSNNGIQATVTGNAVAIYKAVTPAGNGWIPLANSNGVGSVLEPVYVSSNGEVLPCNLRGVYFSRYNDDSLSNILDAFANGLLVFSKYAGDVYLLLDADSNGATFVCNTTVDGKTYYSTLTVNSNNVWSQTRDNIFNSIAVRQHYGANHEASVITTATDISNGYVEYALDFTDMQFGGGLSIVFVSLPNESALAYHFTRIDVMTYPYNTGYSSIDICKFTDLTHDDDGNAIGANDEYTWIRTCNSPNYGQRIKGIKLRAYLNMTSGLPWDAGIELKLKIDFNAVRFDKL